MSAMELDPLTGPPPAWRVGYRENEPIYRSVVADFGPPGMDGPNGGDVVKGEVLALTETKEKAE